MARSLQSDDPLNNVAHDQNKNAMKSHRAGVQELRSGDSGPLYLGGPTTPHAASAAIRAFPTSVLIAGGRNKDLDLSPMAAEGGALRGVVAIGEAASEISDVFGGLVEVVTAGSMETAVDLAARLADGHGEVVLSPGCASFDWYPSGGYPARGDHFIRLVRERMNQEVSELSGGAK